MSDYFAILAARVAGAADAVRPLLPARYELASGPAPVEDAAAALVEYDQPVAAAAPAFAARIPPPPPPTFRQPAPSPFQQPMPEHRPPAIIPPPRQITPRGEPERDAPDVRTARFPKRAAAELGTREEPRAARLQPHLEGRRATAVPRPPPVLEPAPLDDPTPVANPRRPASAESGPPRFPDSRGIAGRAALKPPGGVENGVAAKAAPSIHISIGRIEVHAQLPPAAAPATPGPRRAGASVLSLDDYLAGRNTPAF